MHKLPELLHTFVGQGDVYSGGRMANDSSNIYFDGYTDFQQILFSSPIDTSFDYIVDSAIDRDNIQGMNYLPSYECTVCLRGEMECSEEIWMMSDEDALVLPFMVRNRLGLRTPYFFVIAIKHNEEITSWLNDIRMAFQVMTRAIERGRTTVAESMSRFMNAINAVMSDYRSFQDDGDPWGSMIEFNTDVVVVEHLGAREFQTVWATHRRYRIDILLAEFVTHSMMIGQENDGIFSKLQPYIQHSGWHVSPTESYVSLHDAASHRRDFKQEVSDVLSNRIRSSPTIVDAKKLSLDHDSDICDICNKKEGMLEETDRIPSVMEQAMQVTLKSINEEGG